MSSSISIPSSAHSSHNKSHAANSSSPDTAPSSFAASSVSGSSYGAPRTPRRAFGSIDHHPHSEHPRNDNSLPSSNMKGKGKQTSSSTTDPLSSSSPRPSAEEERARWANSPFRRRTSLMGAELARQEHIVVDLGPPGAPRLFGCVASSQGFDWNRSIFLPRYMSGMDAEDLETRRDEVEDIVIGEDEARSMLPDW